MRGFLEYKCRECGEVIEDNKHLTDSLTSSPPHAAWGFLMSCTRGDRMFFVHEHNSSYYECRFGLCDLVGVRLEEGN